MKVKQSLLLAFSLVIMIFALVGCGKDTAQEGSKN